MKIAIYMKSGNVITQTRVKEWEVKWRGNEVTAITVVYNKFFPPSQKLIMGALDLSQIEAMVRS